MRFNYSALFGLLAISTSVVSGLSYPIGPPKSVPIPGGSPVEMCDIVDEQILKVFWFEIDPNPPVAGAGLTVNASGIVKAPILNGSFVNVEVKYGLVTLLRERFDICDQLPEVNLTCPVTPGRVDIYKEVEIPAEVPPGQYQVVARAYEPDEVTLITCLTATVTFGADALVDSVYDRLKVQAQGWFA